MYITACKLHKKHRKIKKINKTTYKLWLNIAVVNMFSWYGAEFGYDEDSANGPQYWGDIKEAWETCKTGQIQSPIDLSTNVVQVIPKSGSLKYWTYNPQYATLSNRGHDVAVSS